MKRLVLRYSLMVMFTLLAINYVVNPILNKYGAQLIRKQLDQYYHGLLKGPYFVIMKYYETVPENLIPERTRELQKEFGFPIVAVDLASEAFSTEERQTLETGQMLIRDEWDTYYERVNQTKWVIRLGPLKDLDEITNIWHFNVIAWGCIAFLVALISMGAAFPFWRSLSGLMDAAEKFGQGDFGARVRVSKRSALYQMAEIFNGMADRIGRLIRSQKFLINAVSHELRTPIARIRFGMEMLEQARDRAGVKRYASGIVEDIEDLESLVSELLTYTAFDGEKKFLSPRSIDTASWFKGVIGKLAPLAGEKQLKLDIIHAPDTFEADPKFLSRALENLVLNGLRHARSFVRIQAETLADQLEIRVTDDGPGIPEGDMERIFDPFVRLDESRNRDSGGYGLGLSIVRQIAVSHGGRVWAQKGDGACFVMALPLKSLKHGCLAWS